MKKIAIILFSTLLSFQTAYASPPTSAMSSFPSKDIATNAQAIELSPNTLITPETQRESNESLKYSIKATYPQIKGEKLSSAESAFNQAIKNQVMDEIQKFKTNVNSQYTHRQTLPLSLQQNRLRIDYDVDLIQPKNQSLISVRLAVEGMQAGNAHPYHYHRVLNYDLKNSKTLTFKDIFKPQADYLRVFSHYSTQKLQKSLQSSLMVKNGAAPYAKNFQTWNLEPDGILITFSEYQVGPYAEGPQEIHIPYSALKNLISPKASILSCADGVTSCGVQ